MKGFHSSTILQDFPQKMTLHEKPYRIILKKKDQQFRRLIEVPLKKIPDLFILIHLFSNNFPVY